MLVMPSAEANHSWGGYHWARTANPLHLSIGDNVTAAWDGHYTQTVADWDGSTVLALSGVAGTSSARKCRPVAGTVQVCNAAYGRNGWLGLASIWLTGGTHITQGTTKMNDSYYMDSTEMQHVMCQEVGHTFGLGHTSEDGSVQNTCMDYSTSTTSTRPNQHDFDQMATIYSHTDSFNSATGSTASSACVGNDRASWGREVYRSADGSRSTFVRQFGGGAQVVSEVVWA
jgi:hypothetical protein